MVLKIIFFVIYARLIVVANLYLAYLWIRCFFNEKDFNAELRRGIYFIETELKNLHELIEND